MALLDKSGIIARLALADANAKKELDILRGPDCPALRDFAEHVRRYILCKFLLDDEEPLPETEDLNELARLSVAKAGRLNPNEAALLDVSRHCGATSSFMTKKVLLFMSISRELCFDYAPYNTADIETVTELSRIIRKKLGRTDS